MYGKILCDGETLVLGDDGNRYQLSGDSCDLPEACDADTYVAFNSIEVDSGHYTAQITRVISPQPVNRQDLQNCVDTWHQDATQDRGTFVPTDAYREVAGNRCFVIGRKGVGKSALVKALIKDGGRPGDVFSFEHFDFGQLYKLDATSFTQARYKPIWVILFITSAISVLAKSDQIPPETRTRLWARLRNEGKISKSGFVADFVRLIDENLDKPHFDAAGDVIGTGLAAVTSLPINPFKAIRAVVGFVNSRNSGSTSVPDTEKSLVQLQDEIIEFYLALENRPEVVIAFDQLDEEYREKNAKEYPELIESLFSASTWLLNNMTTSTGCGLGIKPVVILRDDIFETQFATTNKAKYLNYMVRPEWDKSTLQEVISARLSQVAGRTDRPFEDLWLDVFMPFYRNPKGWDRSADYQSSYNCFIRHTSRTPRDVIELLKECMKSLLKTNNNGKNRCDYQIFIQARKEFAKYYYVQVIDGMVTAFPNIIQIFDAIKDAQSPTMARSNFGNLIRSVIRPQEIVEKLHERLSSLCQAISLARSEDTVKLIEKQIDSVQCEIDARSDAQQRELLKLMWDVCAIGLNRNKSYRAKYLNYENFSVKDQEQIVFHPALAVHWNMDVSVLGNPLEDRDSKRETDHAQKFERSLLADTAERERIAKELNGKVWELRLIKFAARGLAVLANKSFPNNILCAPQYLPEETRKDDIFQRELVVASDAKFPEGHPNQWNFYIKGTEPSKVHEKFTRVALNDPVSRLVLESELRSRKWEMTVHSRTGNTTILSHPDFPQNVICLRKTLVDHGIAVSEGDKITVIVKTNLHNDRWNYIVSHIKR